MCDHRHQRRLRQLNLCLLTVLLLSVTSSCATTTLWGGRIHDQDNDGSAEIHATGGPEMELSVWTKILATPFTLVFDICTFPVQAWLYGWEGDEEDGREHRGE